jgi:hypothetical protein
MLWPIHPKPINGESLSSWLLRTADGNGLDLSTFRRQQLPKVLGAGDDIDLIDSSDFFSAAASCRGVVRDRITTSTTSVQSSSLIGRNRLDRNGPKSQWFVTDNLLSKMPLRIM